MQRPISKVRFAVEPLGALHAFGIGFHDAIRPYLVGSGHDATTARSIIQDTASAARRTAHVKSMPLSDDQATALVGRHSPASIGVLSSGHHQILRSRATSA